MLSPLPTNQWNFNSAVHLFVRARFGGQPVKIEKLRTMGPAKAIDSFVEASPDFTPSPTWADPHEDELVKQIKEAPTKQEKQVACKVLNEKFNS